MSQNETLIGCLAEADQDQHLKSRPQNHILFHKVFFDKKRTKPLSVEGIPSALPEAFIFFPDSLFSKFETERYPHSRKGREGVGVS